MNLRLLRPAIAAGKYAIQKLTKYKYDIKLEQELREQAEKYLFSGIESGVIETPKKISINSLHLSDTKRFHLVRDDIYGRFNALADGVQQDSFGRKGIWLPRGCKVYFDQEKNEFVKVFGEHFSQKGEGAFLEEAINKGLYRFLCPGLKYLLINENGILRGYSIEAGRILTHYEFERYINTVLREIIKAETERTNFYFYDLTRLNVIIRDNQISFIDLESVLPISWFGQGIEFSRQHLDKVDLGWVVQNKWHSPKWYKKYIKKLVL